jgi:chromosome segregation ATPase
MPKALRGMPPQVREAAARIQQVLQRQRGLIERAQRAKTPEERQAVFEAVARNVSEIAALRVTIMKAHADRARERVAWARRHAEQVKLSDLVAASRGLAGRGAPRSPFDGHKPAPEPKTGPLPQELAELPDAIARARQELERTHARLAGLRQAAKTARTDEQRAEIRAEIEKHLRTVESQRVAILEAVAQVSERRLAWARKRANP